VANVSDLTNSASLCVVALLCATQMSRAQTTGQTGNTEVGSLVESNPGLGRPNPLQLPKPLRDANGNLLHHSGRPIEIVASPVIIYPTSIDVMQVFIPWEFRVAGMFER
jgi:hypothetical protein